MEWIGQQVYDFVATFRSGIIIDDINITTIQSSSESFADNDTSLMTSAAIEDKILSYGYSTGDITGVTITTDSGGGSAASDTAGSADFSILGSSGVGVTNSGTTITAVAVPAEIDHDSLLNFAANEHFTQANITTVGTIGTGTWEGDVIASAYLDSDTAHLSGTQSFTGDKTFEGNTVINKATFIQLDGDKSVTPGDGAMIHADTSTITDSNTSASGTAAEYNHVHFEGPTLAATNASVTTTDASVLKLGRMLSGTNQTLTNSWSLYAVGPISTAGLTNTGSYAQTSGDMTLYHAANDANPTFSIGSSATERLEIKAEYESGAQGLDVVKFITRTAGSSTNDARYAFQVDEEFIFSILDDGINIGASGNISIGGVDILDDASGTTTLKNIDALDATTEATIESAIDTLGNLTSASSLATVGTISSGTWNGGVIASAYLDADTAHYSATRQVTHHMILDDLDSDIVYISLLESDAENTSAPNKHLPLIAPGDGKLLKIHLRTTVDQSGETFTWKLYTRSLGVSTGGAASQVGAKSVTGPDVDEMATCDFTTGVTGTNAIAAGDKVQISIEASDGSTANGSYFITCVWEWNLG